MTESGIDGDPDEQTDSTTGFEGERTRLVALAARVLGDRVEASRGGTVAPDDPVEHLMLTDSVGLALQVVLSRLTPAERVAFVLHDSFGFDFTLDAGLVQQITFRADPETLARVVRRKGNERVVREA